jgi:hypothetical protein
MFLLAVILFIFNPILPVYLYDRSVWVVLDLSVAAFLLFYPVFPTLFLNRSFEEQSVSKEKNVLPDWVDFPEHQRRNYLDDALELDPWVGNQNYIEVDFEEKIAKEKRILNKIKNAMEYMNPEDEFKNTLKELC